MQYRCAVMQCDVLGRAYLLACVYHSRLLSYGTRLSLLGRTMCELGFIIG
jgi:hypothetical protein